MFQIQFIFLFTIILNATSALDQAYTWTESLRDVIQSRPKHYSEFINQKFKLDQNSIKPSLRSYIYKTYTGVDQPTSKIEIYKTDISAELIQHIFQHSYAGERKSELQSYIKSLKSLFKSHNSLKAYRVSFEGYFYGCDQVVITNTSPSALLIGSCWYE